jgi:hypothetical protein
MIQLTNTLLQSVSQIYSTALNWVMYLSKLKPQCHMAHTLQLDLFHLFI